MTKTSVDVAELESFIAPLCESQGLGLVAVRLLREPQGRVLRVLIEPQGADASPPGVGGVTLDDCTRVSRALSEALDERDDLIGGAYHLEVGSPGVERPLVRLSDYERFAGREVRIKTREPVGTRKTFTTTLVGRRNENIVLREKPGDEIEIPFCNIAKANLVFRF